MTPVRFLRLPPLQLAQWVLAGAAQLAGFTALAGALPLVLYVAYQDCTRQGIFYALLLRLLPGVAPLFDHLRQDDGAGYLLAVVIALHAILAGGALLALAAALMHLARRSYVQLERALIRRGVIAPRRTRAVEDAASGMPLDAAPRDSAAPTNTAPMLTNDFTHRLALQTRYALQASARVMVRHGSARAEDVMTLADALPYLLSGGVEARESAAREADVRHACARIFAKYGVRLPDDRQQAVIAAVSCAHYLIEPDTTPLLDDLQRLYPLIP